MNGIQIHRARVPKRHYGYGAIKLKKKKTCIEFHELEFQSATIRLQNFFLFIFFFKFSVCYNSIVQKLSFKLKLDF